MTSVGFDLVLIKGAPGVGKSTAARVLAAKCPAGALVEVDSLRRMVVSVSWKDQAEHRSVLDLSARLAAGFLCANFAPVIVVDTFSGDKIHGFLASFLSEFPQGRVLVAVLHATDAILTQRVLGREEGGFRDVATCKQINTEAVREVSAFEVLIDTSSRGPGEVAEVIAAALGVEC